MLINLKLQESFESTLYLVDPPSDPPLLLSPLILTLCFRVDARGVAVRRPGQGVHLSLDGGGGHARTL